jgi:hypothetical protein
MVTPPPRRDSTYSKKDRLYSEKSLPQKGELRVSKTTLLWFKRLALVVGVVVAILAALALIVLVNQPTTIPNIENPRLDRDAAAAVPDNKQ